MEDEIDLQQIVMTLVNARWLIAGVTAVAVLASAVLSFFVLSPQYRATATVLVHQPDPAPTAFTPPGPSLFLDRLPAGLQGIDVPRYQDPGPEVLLSQLRNNPPMSLETLRNQITNESLLLKVISELNLDMTAADLANRVETKVPKDTTLIQISVNDTDPARSARIVNALAAAHAEFVNRLNQGMLQRNSDFLRQQIQVEEKNLSDAIGALKKFVEQPRGVEDLTREMEAKVDLLARYKVRQIEVGEQANLTDAIARLERDLGRLRAELAEKQTTQDQLQQKLRAAKDTIAALNRRLDEVRISQGARILESTLTIASPATPPVRPVGPRKALNLAVAGVLGLMVGVFLAYFLEFWKKTVTGAAPSQPAGIRS